MFKKVSAIIIALCLVTVLVTGCGKSGSGNSDITAAQAETEAKEIITNLSKPDMNRWQYSEDYDVYYQAEIDYCEKPADETYEKLAIFVPGAYINTTENEDGTYTCKLNENADINGYTASTAPIVIPVNTPFYAADKALTYSDLNEHKSIIEIMTDYTSKGFVFVHAGCRGIEEGAPAGVTDLKAAVRYLRYSDDIIAGDAESIFVFGMSGGGAQAAILGASGDSELYNPYLEAIGVVQGVSDSVKGSMNWCPVCDVDTSNAAYEWMMGCTRTDQSYEQKAISDALANAFADYINSAGFTDKDGNTLTLKKSKEGIYQAGSYYDYIKRVIEHSLNNYLSDIEFTDCTEQEYIDELNANKKWINYDKSTNTATITSVEDFVKKCKKASDWFLAFDQPGSRNTLFGYGDGKGAHFDRILTDILTKLNSEYADEYIADLEKTDSFGNTAEQRVKMYAPLYYLLKSQDGYGKSKVAKYWRIRSGIEQNTNALTTEVNLSLALEHCEGVESVDFETIWAQNHSPAERKGTDVSNFIEWVDACMKG